MLKSKKTLWKLVATMSLIAGQMMSFAPIVQALSQENTQSPPTNTTTVNEATQTQEEQGPITKPAETEIPAATTIPERAEPTSEQQPSVSIDQTMLTQPTNAPINNYVQYSRLHGRQWVLLRNSRNVQRPHV